MRRRRSVKERATALELSGFPSKSVELEQRISRLELSIRELHDHLEGVAKRCAALQAQLDHLLAQKRF